MAENTQALLFLLLFLQFAATLGAALWASKPYRQKDIWK